MAFPKPTYVHDIFVNLRQRLMDQLDFPPERVLVVAQRRGRIRHDQADTYLELQPGAQSPVDISTWHGAGRYDLRVNRVVRVKIWTRLALDEINEDFQRLTNASLGHLKTEGQVYDALAGYQPTDDEGNWLVAEPIRPGSATEPDSDGEENGWINSTVSFDMEFLVPLDITYQ